MSDPTAVVEVLGAQWCVDTARALRCLRRVRVPFAFSDVDYDLDALAQATSLSGGHRRTPVVKVGPRVLVEPSNATLLQALEDAGWLAPSTVLAFEHGQNVGNLERVLRVTVAGLMVVSTQDLPWPLRMPLRAAAVGLALTAATGWCPVYDAQGVTSVGGPGDHPDEAEREPWWAPARRLSAPLEPPT